MRLIMSYLFTAIIILGIKSSVTTSIDETPGNLVMPSLSFNRGLDDNLQFGRTLLMPQRICHPKRNSELINSLLGLPKNMNNAGK